MKITTISLISSLLLLPFLAFSQVSGTVFRDYNGDGIQGVSAPNIEPGVIGVTINGYDSDNALLATQETSSTGGYAFPSSGMNSIPNGTDVRLEFVLPNTGICSNSNSDFSGFSAITHNSSIQFVTGNISATNINYAINNPADYVDDTNPSAFVPCYVTGDPLGAGTTSSADWFVGFPYNITGTTAVPQKLTGDTIGTVWGVAYSKQAEKIFTSAFLKRHSGYGIMGSGGIYVLTPTPTSFTPSLFFDMDAVAHGGSYRTRADTSIAPAYGNGTSYTINGAGTELTYLGATDGASGLPIGFGVIGDNGTDRGLHINKDQPSNDPAAFDQVGKVGLGDLEISDDGKFLFVTNLYDKKVYRLELDDAANPTSVTAVTSYSLPSVSVTNGVLRPFATKYHRGKLYVGAVATGENGGQNIVDGLTDLYAYVFELNNPRGTAIFNSTPTITYALNYHKGASLGISSTGEQWYHWTNNTDTVLNPSGTAITYPSPILSDIEFTDKNAMIMSFTDRAGHQWGWYNYWHLSGTALATYRQAGDILIAGLDCQVDTFSLENNGSYSINGVSYSGGTGNNQGPGGGEFFNNEFHLAIHEETVFGAVSVLKGDDKIKLTIMDPLAINQGGTVQFSTQDGSKSGGYVLYQSTVNSSSGTFGKASGLGDIELATGLPSIEIGNRVWEDRDADGIQEAGESGLDGLTILLFEGGSQVGIDTTIDGGQYYFTDDNVAGGIKLNTNYEIRIDTFQSSIQNLSLTIKDVNTDTLDLIDSDGILSGDKAIIAFTTGSAGQNNHSYDFGFTTNCIIGPETQLEWGKIAFQDNATIAVEEDTYIDATDYDDNPHHGFANSGGEISANWLRQSFSNIGGNGIDISFAFSPNSTDAVLEGPDRYGFAQSNPDCKVLGDTLLRMCNDKTGTITPFTAVVSFSKPVLIDEFIVASLSQISSNFENVVIRAFTDTMGTGTTVPASTYLNISDLANDSTLFFQNGNAGCSVQNNDLTNVIMGAESTNYTYRVVGQNNQSTNSYGRVKWAWNQPIQSIAVSTWMTATASVTDDAYVGGAHSVIFSPISFRRCEEPCLLNITETYSDNCMGSGTYTADWNIGISASGEPDTDISYQRNSESVQSHTLTGTTDTLTFVGIPADGGLYDTLKVWFTNKSDCGDTIILKRPLPCPAELGINPGEICSSISNTEIKGTAFEDWNYDGAMNQSDTIGVSGVQVLIYDCDNIIVDTAYTDSNGNFQFTGLTTGENYRIEFRLPEAISCWAKPTQAGVDNGTTVQFVQPGDCASLGLASPSDYCQTNPYLGAACYSNGDPTSPATGALDAFVSFPYNATSPNNSTQTPSPTPQALAEDIGSTWGAAFQASTKTMFAAAVMRRFVGFGPLGTGGIYKFDMSDPGTSLPGGYDHNFIDLTTIGIPTGVDTRNPSDPCNSLATSLTAPAHDIDAWPAVGTLGIGDIHFDQDNNTLWLVNLNDQKLYGIQNIDPATTPIASDVVGGVDISLPTGYSCSGGNLRPWAVTYHRGMLYVGAVCDSEFDLTLASLKGYILKIDPNNLSNGFSFVTEIDLNYNRVHYDIALMNTFNWDKWYSLAEGMGSNALAQPIVSNIEFDVDGSLIIGLVDRGGLQTGHQNYNTPNCSQTTLQNSVGYGDILRLCKNGDTYLQDSQLGCTTPTNSLKLAGADEYYWGEHGPIPGSGSDFNEIATGGLAAIIGSKQVLSNAYDPIGYYQGGTITFDNSTGGDVNRYYIYSTGGGPGSTFGKATGIGEPQLACNSAPIEIGNYVFIDTDENGIQNACDSGLQNIVVLLINENCDTIAIDTTDANGQYYFNDPKIAAYINQSDTILYPDTTYYVVIAGSTTDAFSTTDSTLIHNGNNYFLTSANQGSNDLIDSDGIIGKAISSCDARTNGYPFSTVNTQSVGCVDHSLDFGFLLCPEIDSLTADLAICSGELVDTLAVTTTFLNPDSIAFVYFKKQIPGTSGNIIYSFGIGLDTVQIQSGNDTVRAFNIAFPEVMDGTPDTFYVYAIKVPTPINPSCRPFDEIRIIVHPLPSISGRDQLMCRGGSIDLSMVLNELPTGILSYATTFGNWNSTNMVSPTIPTTYYIQDSVASTTCIDTAQVLVTILDTVQTMLHDTICSGEPYIFNNQNLTSTNTYRDTLTASNGCDSFLVLNFVVLPCDWGDLADTSASTNMDDYQTIYSNNGPVHVIISGLHLGSSVDSEPGGQQSTLADGDGIDEDGIDVFSSLDLVPGLTFRLPISVTNTTGDTAYVEAWIDWNGDGDFTDTNEMVANLKDNEDGVFPTYLEITIPTDGKKGSLLGFRIRISNTDNMTPYGKIESGEIEDYLLGVDCPQVICIPTAIELKRGDN